MDKMFRSQIILSTLTVFYGIIIMISLNHIDLKNDVLNFGVNENNTDRNERSTPRSFVLPATPAVAFSQENKAKFLTENQYPKQCLSKIEKLGFMIKSKTELMQSEVIEVISEYQGKVGLKRTGEFDLTTREKLGC
jgi:hypothetical protein